MYYAGPDGGSPVPSIDLVVPVATLVVPGVAPEPHEVAVPVPLLMSVANVESSVQALVGLVS